MVPSKAAILSDRAVTSTAAACAAVRSWVSMAKIAPPIESPTKRTPSGPNARLPADFRSALLAFRLSVKSAATPMGATRTRARRGQIVIRYVAICPPIELLESVNHRTGVAVGSRKRAVALHGGGTKVSVLRTPLLREEGSGLSRKLCRPLRFL